MLKNGGMKPMFLKNCNYCSSPFETNNYRKLYCSNTCKTYASRKRNGQISGVQKFCSDDFKEDLVMEHLKGCFKTALLISDCNSEDPIVGEYGPFYARIENKAGVENVVNYGIGKYLLSSLCEQRITSLQERYKGSKVFTGITPFPLEGYGPHDDHYKLFRTIVSREDVVSVDNLEFC